MVKSDRSNGEGNDSAFSPGRRSRYGAQAQLNGLCRRIHDRCQGATGRGLVAILRLDQERAECCLTLDDLSNRGNLYVHQVPSVEVSLSLDFSFDVWLLVIPGPRGPRG